MKLTSKDFKNNQVLDDTFTCRGENCCPQLTISDVPENVESLCLIMHDPDAVQGDFVHWLVWNIDPKITEIEENSLPIGAIEGTTSWGKPGWGGPCPPTETGTHHYIFELYALDTKLDLPETAEEKHLRATIENRILDQTTLTGLVPSN